MSHRSAIWLLLLTSVLWSLGGVLIKSVDWPPMAIAGFRSAMAALVTWGWLGRPRFTFSFAQLGGAVAYAGTVSLFVVASRLTTAANAIFLQYTAPIYVALAGPWFLGERARKSDWWGMALALAGILLFFRDHISAQGGWGIAAGLGSGFSFAAMVIFLRKEGDRSPAAVILLGNLLTAFIGLPFATTPLPSATGWTLLIILGIFQLGVPYLIYSVAIKRVTAIEAIVVPMLEPILNPLWVALARGEIPGPWSRLGAGLVFAAVALRSLAGRNDDQPKL